MTPTYILDKLRENLDRALQGRPVYNRDGEPTGEWQYNGSVANKALELLGRHLRMWSDDGQTVKIDKVLIHLDHGNAGPPVLEGQATEVEALSPVDTEAETYPPPAVDQSRS